MPATIGLAVVLVVLTALGWLPMPGRVSGHQPAAGSVSATPPASTPPTAAAPTSPPVGRGVAVPAVEPQTTKTGPWRHPDSVGPLLGQSGRLLRFRVAVEEGLPVEVWEFTGMVDATLGDPRSWIAGGDVRLQRMPWQAAYDFTIYLASPASAYDLCRKGGVDIREDGVPYTSCRAGDSVVINSDRYFNAVPDYPASLDEYRQYVINHEVGHRLGYQHALCPAPGALAPVMQQQTLGLQGCLANSWPYIDGKQYTGPPVPA
jgi:hypothetical protein